MRTYFKYIAMLFVGIQLSISTSVHAIERTTTGFYYPTGTSSLGSYAGWFVCCENYLERFYHLGKDIQANSGDPVYAIADGIIVCVTEGGWSNIPNVGNVGLGIRHQLSDGTYFLAVYGHIQSNLSEGDLVIGGQKIGTVGLYNPEHLHFGVRTTLSCIAPLGRASIPLEGEWPTYNFVDPINWITSESPSPGLFDLAYSRNGGSAKVGVASSEIYLYGPYLRQDFSSGQYMDCSIMYDPNNRLGNPAATNEAYLLRTGFYEYYFANGGWEAFGCPSRDEYHPDTGDPGDAIQFFVRRVGSETQFHYMYYDASKAENRVSWHSTYATEYFSQDPSGQFNMYPGETKTFIVSFRNNSSFTWYNNPNAYPYDYVELKSCNSSGTVTGSYLYDSSWKNWISPCTFNTGAVHPGQVARFVFKGKVSSTAKPGLRKVYSRLTTQPAV